MVNFGVLYKIMGRDLIETYYRTDKELTLLRLFDRVTLHEQFHAVEELLEQASEPPYGYVLMVDARQTRSYDLTFMDIVRFTLRLSKIYQSLPYPLLLRVLVEKDWQKQVVKRFAAGARLTGNIAFDFYEDEADLLASIDHENTTLDELFPRSCLVRRYWGH